MLENCSHFVEGHCLIAEAMAGHDCLPDPRACEKCTSIGRGWNEVTVGVALASMKRAGDSRLRQRLIEWHGLIRLIPGKRVVKWCLAVGKWVKAGRPVRGDSDTAIVVGICASCEHLRDGCCCLCGCRISADGPALRNKARMATEHCPIEKW